MRTTRELETDSGRGSFAPSLMIALGLHMLLAMGMPRGPTAQRAPVQVSQMIDIVVPSPAPEPVAAERSEAAPPQRAPKPAVERVPHDKPRVSAPAAAASPSASAALAPAPSQTDLEPVDLTSGGFVLGTSSSLAGGQSPMPGTREAAAPGAEVVSTSRELRGDHGRSASVLGDFAWHCPFPAEADAARIDDASVTLRVEVDARGVVERVATLIDPGFGFAREAAGCATSRSWSAALDQDGAPIRGAVTIRIRFER